MRIAINGYFLQQPATGSGEHIYYLLEGLDGIEDPSSYIVAYPRLAESRTVRLPPLGPRFEMREVKGTARRLGVGLGKLWWEQAGLLELGRSESFDLLHCPYFASPLFPNVPTVVTIHDVIPLVLPEYRRAIHVRLYTHLVSAAARRARAITTVSETAKKDIVRTLGIPADRVHVIYNAADSSLHPVADRSTLEALRETYGIEQDFLLYFGGFDVRKNVMRVVRAFGSARESFQRPCQLLLAGSLGLVGHPLYPDPRPLIRKLGLESKVVLAGRIPEEDKAILYSASTALVFPSLYEGFGMPVLEAMACGTPVVTSKLSSLPEVAGDAALMVDPTDVEALAGAMVRMVNDRSLRDELAGKGLRRASEFRWEDSAMKTLEVYRRAMSVGDGQAPS